jgi:hypothetical protein
MRKPLPEKTQQRFREYEKRRRELAYSLPLDTYRNNAHHIDATHCAGDNEEERIWVSFRKGDSAQMFMMGLNPDVAFEFANAILAEGGRMGWYSVSSVDGVPVPKDLN